jgi:hypothetical protein
MKAVCQFAAPVTMDINAGGNSKQYYASASEAPPLAKSN